MIRPLSGSTPTEPLFPYPPLFQSFTTVPFGLNFQGMTAWLYHGGGQKLWEELYAPFDLVPMAMGNTGVQMTGWYRKPITGTDDYKGLKMRSEEHTSELQSLMRNSSAVFCLKKQKN